MRLDLLACLVFPGGGIRSGAGDAVPWLGRQFMLGFWVVIRVLMDDVVGSTHQW